MQEKLRVLRYFSMQSLLLAACFDNTLVARDGFRVKVTQEQSLLENDFPSDSLAEAPHRASAKLSFKSTVHQI